MINSLLTEQQQAIADLLRVSLRIDMFLDQRRLKCV
jgi:hypothetical protein